MKQPLTRKGTWKAKAVFCDWSQFAPDDSLFCTYDQNKHMRQDGIAEKCCHHLCCPRKEEVENIHQVMAERDANVAH